MNKTEKENKNEQGKEKQGEKICKKIIEKNQRLTKH